jgi:hypothetical protein
MPIDTIHRLQDSHSESLPDADASLMPLRTHARWPLPSTRRW